ncbi:hypothetical protein F5Y01DRAFT_312847 [Xylaria sp. FL0043]|nr:hypothetical protein F5Y01DRAFT_312847 [Xylaria sp. FL0043]
MPEIVARPYGYGTYEKTEDVHFFLCSFHKLTDDIPDIDEFPALVAEMHRRQTPLGGNSVFQTGPNKIKPRIVHGDLWDGNCSVDVNTNHPVIFDATSVWGRPDCFL